MLIEHDIIKIILIKLILLIINYSPFKSYRRCKNRKFEKRIAYTYTVIYTDEKKKIKTQHWPN